MKRFLLCSLLFLSFGCSPRAPVSNQGVTFAVEQSHTVVKAGEAVTFTAHATGTSGRDEKIKWEAKGGEGLELVNGEERYARVEYDKPGLYTVNASLYVDSQLIDQEQVTVQVEPLM